MITASYCERNGSVEVEKYTADATFSVDYSDKPGERVLIYVENNNETQGYTATVQVIPGDFISKSIGTASVDVGPLKSAVIGPLETSRFKNSDGEVEFACSATGSGTISNVKVAVIKLP